MRFSNRFLCFSISNVFYLCCLYILFGFQRLNSKFVDGEIDLCHECEVVGYNKLNLQLVDKNFARFGWFCCGLRAFRFGIISIGDSPNAVVIWVLYGYANKITSVDPSVFFDCFRLLYIEGLLLGSSSNLLLVRLCMGHVMF